MSLISKDSWCHAKVSSRVPTDRSGPPKSLPRQHHSPRSHFYGILLKLEGVGVGTTAESCAGLQCSIQRGLGTQKTKNEVLDAIAGCLPVPEAWSLDDPTRAN